MPLEIRKFGQLADIFSDIHGEQKGNSFQMEVTFAVDVQVENLAAAFYMDGSKSMLGAGNYGQRTGLFGLGRQRNPVQEAMQVAVPFITEKDANGLCYVAYWACGEKGKDIEVIGELTAEQAKTSEFRGPNNFGNSTYLLPAVQDFVQYIRQAISKGEVVNAALCVIVTDGQFHDAEDVISYTATAMVPAIMEGKFPKTVFTVIGIGKDVDPEQMEEFSHEATPENYTGRDIWCYGLADEISQLPQLVAHLADANTPAFFGGASILDEKGTVLKTFEDMVPTVVEFELPLNARSFTLKAGDKTYQQQFTVVESDHDE